MIGMNGETLRCSRCWIKDSDCLALHKTFIYDSSQSWGTSEKRRQKEWKSQKIGRSSAKCHLLGMAVIILMISQQLWLSAWDLYKAGFVNSQQWPRERFAEEWGTEKIVGVCIVCHEHGHANVQTGEVFPGQVSGKWQAVPCFVCGCWPFVCA